MIRVNPDRLDLVYAACLPGATESPRVFMIREGRRICNRLSAFFECFPQRQLGVYDLNGVSCRQPDCIMKDVITPCEYNSSAVRPATFLNETEVDV